MSEQPAALRLADALETYGPAPWANSAHQAAAELRRLHEENQKLQQQLGEAVWNYGEKVRINQELLAALKAAKWFVGYCTAGMVHSDWVKAKALRVFGKVKDAIAKGEQA